MTDNVKDIGSDVGLYLLERIEPHPTGTVTFTELWKNYEDWCRLSRKVPLASGIFYEELETIVKDAGIGRWQNGGHVSYKNMVLKHVER